MNGRSEVEPEVRSERFLRSIKRAMQFIRRVKGFSKDKKLYLQVFLRSGVNFYTSRAAAWVDAQSKEETVLFITKTKSIIVSLNNIDRIELLDERPKDQEISGFIVKR